MRVTFLKGEWTDVSALLPFSKLWLRWEDQLALLEQRGLVVTDRQSALDFLAHVNYYRFSGYCLAFETNRHQFAAGATFGQVQEAYEFDRVLRDLVTEALEVVEIDIRTSVAYRFGELHGAFGHVSSGVFHHRFPHAEWLRKLREETERSQELFVKHFRRSYSQYPDLPVWVATEIMSFGSLSRMFSGMLKPDQSAIARRYGLQADVMASWMHHFVYVRNVCAHHARLWDRVWAIKPSLPHGKNWASPAVPGNDRLFTTLLALKWLLSRCGAANPLHTEWRDRVTDHLGVLPAVPNAASRVGLNATWRTNVLWG
jgi:abortive infection bacteriophage resistance protein